MSVFYTVDLKQYCNHKLIYAQMPKPKEGRVELGLDNIFIRKSDLKLKENEILDEVNFKFSFGKYDNVICDRQSIKIDHDASKLHIIGFAYWGDTNEYFKVIYEDLSEELLKVPFIDWSHKVYESFSSVTWYGNNSKTVKITISSGASTHLVYFHHSVNVLKKDKKIKEIVLPDNMFTHIFALTLENENCHIENKNQEE